MSVTKAERRVGVSFLTGSRWWREAGAMKLGSNQWRSGLANPGDVSRPGGRGRRLSAAERVTIMRGRDGGLSHAEIGLHYTEGEIKQVKVLSAFDMLSPRYDLPQRMDDVRRWFEEAGLVEGPMDVPSALERTRIELEVLVRNSLTIEEAAKALRVSTSRIRQRLSSKHPTLYGIKEGRGWRIPRFQFESKGRLVRGIDAVMLHVRRDAHPVVVRDWFTTPHQDLVVGDDDERVTPRAWLSAGRSPDAVAALADEI